MADSLTVRWHSWNWFRCGYLGSQGLEITAAVSIETCQLSVFCFMTDDFFILLLILQLPSIIVSVYCLPQLHYYQPIWTLVGAGLKGFRSSVHPMRDVLPSTCDWIKEKAVTFNPRDNYIVLESGAKVCSIWFLFPFQYEYFICEVSVLWCK